MLYGKDFEDETIPIEKIVGEMGEVTIRCQVMTLETREIRNEKTIVIMSVTDFTDSIVLKIFLMPTIEPIVSSLSNLSMVVTPLIFRKAPFFTPSSNSGSWSFLVKDIVKRAMKWGP